MNAMIPEVADCMTPGPDVIAPNDTLLYARSFMQEHGIRHLPVMRDGELVGILSDRDVNPTLATKCSSPDSLTVEDAMSRDPYAVPPNTPLTVVALRMAERKIGSTVVVDGGVVVGVFTTTDALVALTDLLEGKEGRRTYESVLTAGPGGGRRNERDVDVR